MALHHNAILSPVVQELRWQTCILLISAVQPWRYGGCDTCNLEFSRNPPQIMPDFRIWDNLTRISSVYRI